MPGGSCACGAVSFDVSGALPAASACHCSKCRKHTGHYEAGVDVSKSDISIRGEDSITWYFSSEKVRRGFCKVCGTPLWTVTESARAQNQLLIRTSLLDKGWVLELFTTHVVFMLTSDNHRFRLAMKPACAIFTRNRPSWMPPADGVADYEAGL